LPLNGALKSNGTDSLRVAAHQKARFFERTPVQVSPISIIAGA
jgi:hypothetical protein